MSDHISSRRDGAVLRLGFNRPDKKNAITAAMYAALADGLAQAEDDSDIRVVYFESVGDVYTAGNDIADFMAGDSLGDPHATPPVQRFLNAIATASKPLVAAVQGPAVGVGVTMLFHCDLTFAAEGATFHTPFVDLALVPEAASSLLLPQIAGYQRASELLLAGRKIDAAKAQDFGFINEVVSPDALEATALGAAQSFAEKAPTALRLSKRLMRGNRDEILQRMQDEAKLFAEQLKSPEFQEAGAAFMQKRKPDFSKLG
ncbi:MAG: enoyl-CoA hydratase [Pseudomonadota bacterium]